MFKEGAVNFYHTLVTSVDAPNEHHYLENHFIYQNNF